MEKNMEDVKGQAYNHVSVLLNESIEALNIKPNGVYVDATFGGAGHSRAIFEKLGQKGKLIVFDHDETAWANAWEDDRLILVKENFRYMRPYLKYLGYNGVDGILADLGVSSIHFDRAERGFSTRFEGPLDMRMDSRLELTAQHVLNTYSAAELHKILEQLGQVRNSKTLAQAIVTRRQTASFQLTTDFIQFLDKYKIGLPNKYMAQVFQAIRMEVNDELGALKELLAQSVHCLNKSGRLCIITFHSGEDKMVKNFIKNKGYFDREKDMFGRLVGRDLMKEIDDITPGEIELKNNNRARSARLRIGEKL